MIEEKIEKISEEEESEGSISGQFNRILLFKKDKKKYTAKEKVMFKKGNASVILFMFFNWRVNNPYNTSIPILAKELKMSKDTLRRCLKELSAHKLIKFTHVRKNGLHIGIQITLLKSSQFK